jgi:hypothetical protein
MSDGQPDGVMRRFEVNATLTKLEDVVYSLFDIDGLDLFDMESGLTATIAVELFAASDERAERQLREGLKTDPAWGVVLDVLSVEEVG